MTVSEKAVDIHIFCAELRVQVQTPKRQNIFFIVLRHKNTSKVLAFAAFEVFFCIEDFGSKSIVGVEERQQLLT